MTEPTVAPGPGSGYQWRIVIDGDPGRRPPHIGCWIDVVDGDFQNLNVVGRLEFRAKPCATSRRPTFAPRNEDAGGPPGVIDLPTVRALIERAREDTSDGLTAREQLAGVAAELCDALATAEQDRDDWRRASEAEAQGGKARAEMLARVEGVLAKLREIADGPTTYSPGAWRAADLLEAALNGGGDA